MTPSRQVAAVLAAAGALAETARRAYPEAEPECIEAAAHHALDLALGNNDGEE